MSSIDDEMVWYYASKYSLHLLCAFLSNDCLLFLFNQALQMALVDSSTKLRYKLISLVQMENRKKKKKQEY